jgi:PST family polysaccharide transporter
MTAATQEPNAVNPKHQFDKHLLAKNAIALYGVQIGRKLIPLASIPYLARVLGPEGWGKVAFVTAMAEMIGIFIEFGFNISGTRRISHYRHDLAERTETVAGILLSQVFIACPDIRCYSFAD